LSGALPEFSSWRNLVAFGIEDNKIAGSLPETIQEWSNLQRELSLNAFLDLLLVFRRATILSAAPSHVFDFIFSFFYRVEPINWDTL